MNHRHAVRYFAWPNTVILGLTLIPAVCTAEHIYDTTRVLGHSDNECIGVPNCISWEAPSLEIKADQIEVFAVNCPEAFPYIWNWDAEQNEHIFVALVARSDNGFTFSASNLADAPGNLTTYVGCSTEPFEFNDTGYMQSQGGVPSRPRWPQ